MWNYVKDANILLSRPLYRHWNEKSILIVCTEDHQYAYLRPSIDPYVYNNTIWSYIIYSYRSLWVTFAKTAYMGRRVDMVNRKMRRSDVRLLECSLKSRRYPASCGCYHSSFTHLIQLTAERLRTLAYMIGMSVATTERKAQLMSARAIESHIAR